MTRDCRTELNGTVKVHLGEFAKVPTFLQLAVKGCKDSVQLRRQLEVSATEHLRLEVKARLADKAFIVFNFNL